MSSNKHPYTYSPRGRSRRPSHRQNMRVARAIERNPILYVAMLIFFLILLGSL